MADYETIAVKKEDVKQSHILIGKIGKIGRKKDEEPDPGKADVDIEGKGLIKNVEIFYHCENSDKAKGTETLNIPFREKDRVIVINHGDVANLNPDDMRIIGFKDGLPRYCTTQVIYVKQTRGWDIQKCFVWDIEENKYAVIEDSNGDPISFPCDARNEDIVKWQRKQTEVSRQIFEPAQTCGKEEPTCPVFPDYSYPYNFSEIIEEPAACGLHDDLNDVCSRSAYGSLGEEWHYRTIGLYPPVPLYHTPTPSGHSDHIKNYACGGGIEWLRYVDNFRYLQSYFLPFKELKQDGYWRIQHEYTNIGHADGVHSTGVSVPPEIDPGYGSGHREIIGTMKSFSHFCDEIKGDACIRELNYSVVWSNLGYRRLYGPYEGTITITDFPVNISFMGQARCSNKIIVNIVYAKHRTVSVVNEMIRWSWSEGQVTEYGEKTYQGGIDITAQADFYPNKTDDVKVRELERNLAFENAVRNMDAEIRNLIPEPENGEIEFILPSVQIYEICRMKGG